jgi:hypothetical protein
MTEHGWATDAWPAIYRQVLAADILVLCGPIWLGDNGSVTKRVVERLYAYYGRVAGGLRPGALLPRPRLGRPRQRLHQPQHHLRDLEPAAPGGAAEAVRRDPGPRQPALGVGRRLPLRLGEPGAPLRPRARLSHRPARLRP